MSLCRIASRGGRRYRHDPAPFICYAMNITSIVKHWRVLSRIQADFLLLSETRATATEQQVVEAALRPHGWRIDWSPPIRLGQAGGMAGRSGGTAVMHSADWALHETPQLHLEAPSHHYHAGEYSHRITGQRCMAITYYGHPDMRQTTLRDISRLEDLTQSLQITWLIGTDLNIDDTDEFELPVHGHMVDLFHWKAEIEGSTRFSRPSMELVDHAD